MDDFALGNPGGDAGLHAPLEDAAEPLGAPTLPDPRERGMIGQPVLQPVAGEPADRQVDLRLAHEPAIMDDPEQEAREHQPDRRLRIDPRAPDVRRIELGDLGRKPRQVEHPVHAREDVIVRNQVTQRAADEELELSPLLPSQHSDPRLDRCSRR